MSKQLFTAIVFFSPFTKKLPFKYRNVNSEENFSDFCRRKLPGSIYFNLYSNQTRTFVKRVWLN